MILWKIQLNKQVFVLLDEVFYSVRKKMEGSFPELQQMGMMGMVKDSSLTSLYLHSLVDLKLDSSL